MKIPINYVDIKTFTVPAGLKSKIEGNLLNGQLPKRIIFGTVRNANRNGDPTNSPYLFENVDISKITIRVDGRSIESNPS